MLTENKGFLKKDLISILIKFKKKHGRLPSKDDFAAKRIQPSMRTFQRKFGTIRNALEEADKYKTVDEFEQKLEEDKKKMEIKAYRRKHKKKFGEGPEFSAEGELILQKQRRKTEVGKQGGFQCVFCGSYITGVNEYHSTLAQIIRSRLINLAKSANGKTYQDGVLDSLCQIFGPENSTVRRELDGAGLLEMFDQRNLIQRDIENE